MLTHDMKTKVKLAFIARKRPAEIAAEFGLSEAAVNSCICAGLKNRPPRIKPRNEDFYVYKGKTKPKVFRRGKALMIGKGM